MLNKSLGVIYFHFNIFSKKTAKKQVLKFLFWVFENVSHTGPFHTTNIRGVPFDFNIQQDVAGILQVVLEELKGVSLAANHLISNTQKMTVSCNTCFCSAISGKS